MAILYLRDAIPMAIGSKDAEKTKTRIVHVKGTAAADVVKLINKGYTIYPGTPGNTHGILCNNILAVYDDSEFALDATEDVTT